MSDFLFELPPVDGGTSSTGSATLPSGSIEANPVAIDHVGAGLARLVRVFQQPTIMAMLAALLSPFADIEQAIVDLLTKRGVNTAVGAQLEVLGRIVKQPKIDSVLSLGYLGSDDIYRSLIRARIRVNKSNGMGNQILTILRFLLTDWIAQPTVAAAGTLQLIAIPQPPASYTIRIDGIDTPWALAATTATMFTDKATAVGVRGLIQFMPNDGGTVSDHDDAFTLGDSMAPSTDALTGLGDSSVPATGGLLEAVVE